MFLNLKNDILVNTDEIVSISSLPKAPSNLPNAKTIIVLTSVEGEDNDFKYVVETVKEIKDMMTGYVVMNVRFEDEKV